MATDLRKEIKQKKPFRSLTQEAQLNVVRTSAVLIDRFEQMLKPVGITGAQYNVLRILQGAGGAGLCRNEIRGRMLTRMPDMTRMLDRMEEAGLVVRERQGDDRRMVNTQLSARGRRILEKLDSAVQAEHQRRFGHLSESQLRSLISMLTSVRNTP
jgi:DNA-binding MarR family transcriptional regulator